jgi:hypothetical protein
MEREGIPCHKELHWQPGVLHSGWEGCNGQGYRCATLAMLPNLVCFKKILDGFSTYIPHPSAGAKG